MASSLTQPSATAILTSDLQEGKEIEEARGVCENRIEVGVSRDGRWVVTAGRRNLNTSEVETGILLAGKLVTGPFRSGDNNVGALRLSEDSRKLAVLADWGRCLQV
ncbi:hypothetical protein BDR04DRAFT_1118053 [Suillus decipiens]|nr:hypothetical protein BDR04DRAFT_1118053 [Suillus decipiens]